MRIAVAAYSLFDIVGGIGTFACILAIVVPMTLMHGASMREYRRQAGVKLAAWAKRNGYELVSQELGRFGPFFGKSSGQVVSRIVIHDREGRHRQGWALCGGWLLGTLSDRVKVQWDDAEPPVSLTAARDPMWDRDMDRPA